MKTSPKIYITAYNCSPSRGSDHASGWNHLLHIAKHVPVTVITDYKYKPDFEERQSLLQNIQVEYIQDPNDRTGLNTINFPWGFYLSYRSWESTVYRYLLKKFQNGEVDLIHRLTLGSLKEPGYSWRIPVPYIWSQAYIPTAVPLRFFPLFTVTTGIVFLLLNMMRQYTIRMDGRVRKALNKASTVFVSNKETQQLLFKYFKKRSEVCYVVGSQPNPLELDAIERKKDETFKIIWVGRVVDFKGIELIVRALANLENKVDYELSIVGDGKDLPRIKKLSKELRVRVNFCGLVPYDAVPSMFRQSDCFIYTSFHDGLPNVIFESLANNCPIICLDHMAYGEVIDESVGLKVAVTSIQQIIRDLADRILFLYNHEDHRQQLIKNIPKFLSVYTWEENAKKIIRAYEKALNLKILDQS